MIEVELKYRIESLEPIRASILRLGSTVPKHSHQKDEYFNHNLQDFAKKDLALRIRHMDGRYWLTFKGPNQDQSQSNKAKIRTEVNLELPDEQAVEKMKAVLIGTGFFPSAVVEKRRETYRLNLNDVDIEICLDDVTDLGLFVELEVLVATGDEAGDAADSTVVKEKLLAIANSFGLANPISTSYLGLLQQA